MAVTVISRAFLRVFQHVIGFVDGLELFLCLGIPLVFIRVVLHGELAVRLFQLILGGVFGNAKYLVIIVGHRKGLGSGVRGLR